jgi:hypothetical protein
MDLVKRENVTKLWGNDIYQAKVDSVKAYDIYLACSARSENKTC